ncbi:MAG: ester cyclase [Actinomycetota bacterium]|nr:ester cyclase [Actinomycetota bacterium]
MSKEENLNIGRRYVDGINSGKPDASLFADDFVYNNPQGVVMDFNGSQQVLQLFNTALPDHHTEVKDEIVTDDRVVYRWETRGTHDGDFFGVPPTGKQLLSRGMTIIKVENGKIRELWESIDILGLMQQMGVIPTPGG